MDKSPESPKARTVDAKVSGRWTSREIHEFMKWGKDGIKRIMIHDTIFLDDPSPTDVEPYLAGIEEEREDM